MVVEGRSGEVSAEGRTAYSCELAILSRSIDWLTLLLLLLLASCVARYILFLLLSLSFLLLWGLGRLGWL